MKLITSAQNPEIKDVAKLADAKERKAQQRFIVEGTRAVTTFIHAGWKPLAIYVTQAMVSVAQELVAQSLITQVDDGVMNKISQTTTPSGIVGIFSIPQPPATRDIGPGIVLTQLSDPGNVGTLIRTCAALGKKTVILIDGVDVWSPKVVQASAGTLALVTVYEWTWQHVQEHKGVLELCALVVSGGEKPTTLAPSSLLVIGSEARGIPDAWLSDCDRLITLPMPGKTESLNAAVAGSIAMYAAWGK